MRPLQETVIKQPGCNADPKPINLTMHVWALFALCMWVSFIQSTHAEDKSSIVKWKDEKGATHYGDRVPPQYSDRENSIMNRQGITVKRNKPINHQEQALDLEKLEQDKKDKALLGAFTNADEIDLARDRNIQLDLIALENLNQEKISNQKQLAENQRLADSLAKKKAPIPDDLSVDISKNQAEVGKINQRISDRKQTIENTRKRFDADKKRYLSLKHQSEGVAP
ncbi:MAG: DUF4124 domain-containing protein [Methylotenera sp.]|nr:DUF4124 domain-containing protein [Methylotenera sp.]MDP1754765.1 DUF4124 domain-containing protein [Methylotenera sp.]MDP1959607.1 DUF4124 domain-containing protein [Methylotenera sp.]MDP3207276.1 DUF4124 domain-containing protein [Methylotenera sp.]MDP3303054.1 DUF4124 domain-containing protein [Methylotenera sp.]